MNANSGVNYAVKLNENELNLEISTLLKTKSPHNIRLDLINQGYDEKSVDSILHETIRNSKFIKNKNSSIVLFKDFFDKVGYGFSSPLFMYVLLYVLGMPLIFIGFVGAIKTFLTLFTSSAVKEYNLHIKIHKKFIAHYGTLFGFSFLLMALGKSINSSIIFSIGILFSSVFVVIHGDLYSTYVMTKLSSARSHLTSKIISYFSLIITAIAFIIAGYFLDFSVITINLFFVKFTIPGYLLVLETVAFAFILSSYVFSFVKAEPEIKKEFAFTKKYKNNFWSLYFSDLKKNFSKFFKNHNIKMLFFGTLFSGAMQTLMSTFAGIYIFTNFQDSIFNKFFYLSLIFGLGILAASVGPSITRKFIKIFGETPILVFGVFLISIFPLSIYFNVSYYALIIAHSVSVLGASCISVVQSFIVKNSLEEQERQTYFSAITPILSFLIPVIIIIFSVLINYIDFKTIFIIIPMVNILFITPFYFNLVIKANKEHFNKNIFS